ncbi:MAG: YaaA family protein [Candidatus Saccharimonadota bacterium]
MPAILLHTSKTTRLPQVYKNTGLAQPFFADQAVMLTQYLKTLPQAQLQKTMSLSKNKAPQVHELIQSFDPKNPTLPALDLFLGDIYSGLQAQSFTPEDREYANNHLFILSGLYGVLKALDEIQPYRLEMGYKLPGNAHDPSQPNITSLYEFWGGKIAQQLPKNQPIINLSAVEYTKAIFPHFKHIDGLKDVPIISPKFLTISPKTGEPTFVTVHAKIARGAYARWLIQNRIEDLSKLKDFKELGYRYDKTLSTPEQPVFVAKEFKGLGLSVRLT